MNNDIIHQINWTIIFILVSSYILIIIFLLKLVAFNQNIPESTPEENKHLLLPYSDSENEDDEFYNTREENNIDKDYEDTNILISMEKDYINDINTLYDIKTNN